ncbi:DUF3710 domain-containing protein [Pseudonocardia spirodelae]|uniref:DUF3710 domain-containing protein n=1 Tax=Pseudonocardia spirodelae TaxID=3133431 RepID=A0ABU8T235_9PSEU
MPGRARGRMFDIRPEDGVEDTGTGAYPGYPGYGDSDIDDFDDYADHYAAQDARRRPAGPVDGRTNGSVNGSGGGAPTGSRPAAVNGGPPAPARGPVPSGPRTGAGRVPGPDALAAPTTAVRAVGRDTARAALPAPAPAEHDERVAPDGRWDDDEPPLLSHRVEDDELAYARDRTPQGFDGGDPDDPAWGRRGPARRDTGAHDTRRADDDADDDDAYDDHDDEADEYDEDEYGVGDAPLSVPPPGSGGRPLGPADVEELDPSMTDALARVDLGALQVPVPYGAELKLEPSGAERPQAVHLLLAEGRIAVSALAAPRSSGLWPDLSAEIEQSLRKGGARVRNARGDWGRELHARTENAASVFVGCDGPRWMVYGVATASLDTVEALDVELRRVLRGIIVVRGKSPYPPRTVLPLELPEHLRETQPETGPQKPSITVSVPVPTGVPTGATTGSTPAPAPPEPARPQAPRRAPAAPAPAAAGPARRPADPTADPATRALPQVRRPAPPERPGLAPAALAGAESPAERTALTEGPLVTPALGEPRTSRRGRPDRPDRTGADRTGADRTGADRAGTDRAVAPGTPPARATPAIAGLPAAGTDRPGPRDGWDVPARDDRRTAVPDPLVDPLPEPALHAPVPQHAPEPAPVTDPWEQDEPPARRDPAVTALSVADLLAGADDDRSAAPRRAAPAAAPGAATAEDALGTGARRSRRDRTGDAGRVDAADLLAGRPTDPAATAGDTPADVTAGATVGAAPRRTGAIEDIPLADVPLMEATLDRTPPPAAPARRRRSAPRDRADGADGADLGATAAPAPAVPADDPADDGWLSAEIAASRRSGRHGAGGTSVADLLAAVALDGPAGGARRRDRDADGPADAPAAQRDGHAAPGPGGDDLFAAGTDPERPWHGGGPTSADEARSALQDLLRSASADRGAAGPADPAEPGEPAAPRTNGHGRPGGVTGLADYRASRAAAGRSARRAAGDEDVPGADGTDDPHDAGPAGIDTGRAAGGSGLTGQWSSGRRANGTGPRDLGRHRRD